MEEKIVYLKLNEIKPYDKNPRKNGEAVEYVKNSIKEFGFKSPILLDKNKIIIAGHTRYLASKELELEEIPCIICDELSEEKVKALRLADNKVSEIASWDFDILDSELEDITDIDMSEFGFDLDSLNDDDIDKFFEEDTSTPKDKPKEEIECPYCHKKFEL